MRNIKIMAFLVLFITNNNLYCALFTVTNKGREPITVNIDIAKTTVLGMSGTPVGTLTAVVKPGETTQKGLNALGGNTAKNVYLTELGKNGVKYRLPLTKDGSKKFNLNTDTVGIYIGGDKDLTFVFSQDKKGAWDLTYGPSKK